MGYSHHEIEIRQTDEYQRWYEGLRGGPRWRQQWKRERLLAPEGREKERLVGPKTLAAAAAGGSQVVRPPRPIAPRSVYYASTGD